MPEPAASEPAARPDLSTPLSIHVVGIGGIGMSGIAAALVSLGHQVSGSDLADSPALSRLAALGVRVSIGHHPEHLPEPLDVLVASTAIPPGNPEIAAAGRRGVAVLRRAEMLQLLVARRRTAAISGTHGKTTTTSLAALALAESGWQPSFLLGGDLADGAGNARWDVGEWLVVEADESDGTFVEIAPEAVVVTNVEPDHLDHHGSFETLVGAFERFLAAAPGPRLAGSDDPVASRLAVAVGGVLTFGEAVGADYRVLDYQGGRGCCHFRLAGPEGDLGAVRLRSPGRHNARNAAGAAALALELGAPWGPVRRALEHFPGVARRFELRGEVGGVALVDDYAHLPAEVAATLSAAREGGWGRVLAVFQPHRYSRTAALWRDFGGAFDDADIIVLTDVYGAGEAPRPGISGRLVLRAVLEARPGARVLYIPRRDELAARVREVARPGDVVLSLGAGDVSSLAAEWADGARTG